MKIHCKGIPGAEIPAEGKSFLHFAGTSYLGMQTHAEFLEMIARHTRRIGSHWGASRVGNIQLEVYGRVEEALASWMGSPACLTLSSGFLAARLLADYFGSLGHPCFFSPNCHEALLTGRHQRQKDWDSLNRCLQEAIKEHHGGTPVVFTDTRGGSTGAGPIWERLEALPRECILVADDSHGLGIVGEDGSGSWKNLSGMGFYELLLCGSLGKAMGITGGVVAGSRQRLEGLQHTPFFAGASPAPPAGLSALGEALDAGLYRQAFQRLINSVRYVEGQVGALELLSCYPDYPVITFHNPALAGYLKAHNILITDFDYAAEGESASPSRIVITSAHQKGHLTKLADLLLAFKES